MLSSGPLEDVSQLCVGLLSLFLSDTLGSFFLCGIQCSGIPPFFGNTWFRSGPKCLVHICPQIYHAFSSFASMVRFMRVHRLYSPINTQMVTSFPRQLVLWEFLSTWLQGPETPYTWRNSVLITWVISLFHFLSLDCLFICLYFCLYFVSYCLFIS